MFLQGICPFGRARSFGRRNWVSPPHPKIRQRTGAGLAMPPGAAPQSGLQRESGHRRGSGGDTRSAYRCQSCRRRPGGGWASMCTPRRPSPPGSSCPGARLARARESSSLPLLRVLLASPKLKRAPLEGPL